MIFSIKVVHHFVTSFNLIQFSEAGAIYKNMILPCILPDASCTLFQEIIGPHFWNKILFYKTDINTQSSQQSFLKNSIWLYKYTYWYNRPSSRFRRDCELGLSHILRKLDQFASFYLFLPHPNFAFFGCPNEVKWGWPPPPPRKRIEGHENSKFTCILSGVYIVKTST